MTESSDPAARDLASSFRDQLWLRSSFDGDKKQLQREIEKRVPEMRAIVAKGLLESIATNDTEPGLRSLAKDFDEIARAGQQYAANRLKTVYAWRELHNSFLKKSESVAKQGGASSDVADNGLSIRFITAPDPKKLGLVTVVNKTNQTLHNCLIVAHVTINAKAGAAGKIPDVAGIPLMQGLGFSEEAVRASAEASAWDRRVTNQERGVLLFVPEFAAGQAVAFPACDTRTLRIAQGVKVSCFTDELAAESVELTNLDEVLETASKVMAAAAQKNRAAQQAAAKKQAAMAKKRRR